MQKEIDVNNWNRKKHYEWFKTFDNPCYGMNVKMDVTNLVKYTKEKDYSFFICMLYIVLNGMNSVEEMRIRLINDKVILFDDINPSYTIMTEKGNYENVRHENVKEFKEFYNIAKKIIEEAKKGFETIETYNLEGTYNEYYITCTPWTDFLSMSHPLPTDKASLSVPRICWGKYTENNNKYELTLNITVNHMFVDGYPLCKVFNNIQDMLNDLKNVLI